MFKISKMDKQKKKKKRLPKEYATEKEAIRAGKNKQIDDFVVEIEINGRIVIVKEQT